MFSVNWKTCFALLSLKQRPSAFVYIKNSVLYFGVLFLFTCFDETCIWFERCVIQKTDEFASPLSCQKYRLCELLIGQLLFSLSKYE